MLPRANSKRQSSDCPHMRTWRNWQTRRFQVPVGDHGGSSPFVRTTQTEGRRYVGSLFVLYRITKGLEGGGVCASKRFARDNPNDQQSMAQTEQPGGLFTGARRQRRKSLRPHHVAARRVSKQLEKSQAVSFFACVSFSHKTRCATFAGALSVCVISHYEG